MNWKHGLGALVLLAGLSMAATWNNAWEGTPDGATDLVSDLDTFIQLFKNETRKRAEVETIWGGTSDDNGLHHLGSARAFAQDAAPTVMAKGAYISSTGASAAADLDTDEPGATTRDVGAGRLWVDLNGTDTTITSDDRELNVWDETTNAFLPVRAQAISSLGSNLIYNGSFEATDGTGSTASTTVAAGWLNLNTADIAYDSVANSTEGDGLAMETIAAAGANEGATQTVAGLKESTTYTVRARVRSVVGTCDLQVTGGAATVTDTSAAASGVFETLEVSPTTTAGPADLVVRLESNVAGDECDWDHITLFESEGAVSPPGIQALYTTDIVADATITNDWSDVFLTTPITVPGPGFVVQVDATVTGLCAGDSILVRLARDDCAGGAFSAVTPVAAIRNEFGGAASATLNYVDTVPVVGGTCQYQVQVREANADCATINPTVNAVQTGSSLRLMLTPTR